MPHRMRLGLYTAMLLCFARCSGAQTNTDATLTGVVRSEGLLSKVIAQATVMASNLDAPVTTGLDGRFMLPQAKIGEQITVQITAEGYAPQTRRISLTGTARDVVNVSMRPQQMSAIILPQAGEAPVTFNVTRNGGSATLSIPGASLIDETGAVANGNATINMTYWSYFDYRSSAPLPLLAQAANANDAPIELSTFGMADITVTQNGKALKVAPNQTLSLTFAIPIQQQELVAALVQDGQLAPRFYSGDQNRGLWVEEGNLSDGKLVFDANAMTMTGQMAHLSTWNLDNSWTNNGGCVAGTLLADDGTTPAANQQVRVYMLSRDEVSSFVATTDANGAYCINTGINVASTTVNYYLSAAADIKQSNLCNPMPSSCSDCTGSGSWQDSNNKAQFCSFCVLRNDAICSDRQNDDINGQAGPNLGCGPRPICDRRSTESDLINNCAVGAVSDGSPLLGYVDTCVPQANVVQIDTCHFCPGTQNLPASCSFPDIRHRPMIISGGTPVIGGCGVLPPFSFNPNTKTPTTVVQVCDPSAKTTRYLGESCVLGADTCCPVTSSLTCADHICVPSTDGTGTSNK